MIPKRHPDTTRYLGAPAGWEPSRHGSCGHLSIADVQHVAGNIMLSRWEPTAAELAVLNAGGSIELGVIGTIHPPVSIGVIDPPRDEIAQSTTLGEAP